MSESGILPHPWRTQFGRIVYPVAASFGPRQQTGIQMVGIESGSAVITVDDRRQALEPGNVCLLLPGTREFFQFDRRRTTCHNWCTVYVDPVPPSFLEQCRQLPFAIPATARLVALLELGLQSYPALTDTTQRMLDHLGMAMLHAWLAAAQGESASAGPPPLQKAVQWLTRHHEKPLSLEDLSRAAHVSPSHLSRLFMQHLQKSPMRYLWDYRTRRGMDLLRQTGLSVQEIARRVGFQSPYHFSRCVRELGGLSPRQLRTRSWQRQDPAAPQAKAACPPADAHAGRLVSSVWLEHRCRRDVHVDWMVMDPTCDERQTHRLWTMRWRRGDFARFLKAISAPKATRWTCTATAIAHHRTRYLRYEGPLSDDRGNVRRLLSRRLRLVCWKENERTFAFKSGKRQWILHARLQDEKRWVIKLEACAPDHGSSASQGSS